MKSMHIFIVIAFGLFSCDQDQARMDEADTAKILTTKTIEIDH